MVEEEEHSSSVALAERSEVASVEVDLGFEESASSAETSELETLRKRGDDSSARTSSVFSAFEELIWAR